MANSVDPDQTVPIGAVCSGSTLFATILNLSVMLGNYLQQTTSADNIFRCIFVLGALRVKINGSLVQDSPVNMCCVLEQDTISSAWYWFTPDWAGPIFPPSKIFISFYLSFQSFGLCNSLNVSKQF